MNHKEIVGNLAPALARRATPWRPLALAWGLFNLSLAAPAAAQSAAPAAPTATLAAPSTDTATRDRLQREAERPMYWIRLHADQARAAEARKPAAAPAAAASAAPALVASPRPAKPAAPSPDRLPPTAAGAAPTGASEPRPALPAVPGEPTASAAVATGPAADPPAAPATTTAMLALPQPAALPPMAGRVEPEPPSAAAMSAPTQSPASTPLELLKSSEPDFPASLVRRLRRGELQVEVAVSDTGEVRGAKVLSSSHPRLNEPALEAIRGWRFRPPGQPASAVIHFRFDIDETS